MVASVLWEDMYTRAHPPTAHTHTHTPRASETPYNSNSYEVRGNIFSLDFLSVKPTVGHSMYACDTLSSSTLIVFSIWEPSLLPASPGLQVLLQRSGLPQSPPCMAAGKGQGEQLRHLWLPVDFPLLTLLRLWVWGFGANAYPYKLCDVVKKHVTILIFHGIPTI